MSYQDQPLLKPPVWTWEIPTYFFVGGAAGAAAVLGVAAQLAGEDRKLVRDARWIAAIGANLSTPLLIADLGRPERFLHMLRVFNPRSPMSVGAWIVAAFGGTSTAALFVPPRSVFAALSALAGLGMSTYTGVLLGVTAIPLWKENARVLPVHFAASALGTACSLLELRGHHQRALQSLAIGAAIFETAVSSSLGKCRTGFSPPGRAEARPTFGNHDGSALMLAAEVCSGPAPLVLRLMGKRKAAAAVTILGSLLTRFAWVQAGKVSARRNASTTSGPGANDATAAPPAQDRSRL
jgi:formate-dependent nitrite reductase membrane component NrfD